jgi:hypothetical protein
MEIDRLPRKKPAWFLTRREQVVQRYDAVKGSFDREPCKKCADKIATLCKNCRTSLTRGISWSPRTVPDMADDVGRQLRNVFALRLQPQTKLLSYRLETMRAIRCEVVNATQQALVFQYGRAQMGYDDCESSQVPSYGFAIASICAAGTSGPRI